MLACANFKEGAWKKSVPKMALKTVIFRILLLWYLDILLLEGLKEGYHFPIAPISTTKNLCGYNGNDCLASKIGLKKYRKGLETFEDVKN